MAQTYARPRRGGLATALAWVGATLGVDVCELNRMLFARLENPVFGRPSRMARGPVGAPTTPTPRGGSGSPVRTVAAPYAGL